MNILEALTSGLAERFGIMGPVYAVGGLGILLVLVAFVMMGQKRVDPMAKFQKTVARDTRSATADPTSRQSLRAEDMGQKLNKFANFLEPQDAAEMSAARLKMMRAGYRSKTAVRTMNAAQFVIGMGLMTLGLAYALISSATGELSTRAFILAIILPGGIGYYLPKYWVERRIQTRQTQIIEGFPDALDLMLVCVEAGQSLDQSILRVSREIRAGYPALADEFEIVGQEVKAGKDRVSVLKDMSERAGVPDVSSFVTVLVQSATFGTSIADALRVYAAEMRDKRVMRAEEKANVLPTKLTLGTMMFTVPPLMIILIGPSIHSIVQTFAMMNK
ncbi:MAG: type II secretion system F family protein [Rhodobacteraceae bacterium]|nr:type II secretion system F family protein [Paracoccaceae bacterium]